LVVEQRGNAGFCHCNKASYAAQYARRSHDRDKIKQKRLTRKIDLDRQLQSGCCYHSDCRDPNAGKQMPGPRECDPLQHAILPFRRI
jgi:hypothetical protein